MFLWLCPHSKERHNGGSRVRQWRALSDAVRAGTDLAIVASRRTSQKHSEGYPLEFVESPDAVSACFGFLECAHLQTRDPPWDYSIFHAVLVWQNSDRRRRVSLNCSPILAMSHF